MHQASSLLRVIELGGHGGLGAAALLVEEPAGDHTWKQ